MLVRWIHGCWISTTLDYPGVEMQMKPLSLLTHLHLFAVQNDLKTLILAVEATMYERLDNNTYKVDIDEVVGAIRLLFSNHTDSMDYDVQEVLLRYSHAKQQELLAFEQFEACLDPEKGLPSFIKGFARQSP